MTVGNLVFVGQRFKSIDRRDSRTEVAAGVESGTGGMVRVGGSQLRFRPERVGRRNWDEVVGRALEVGRKGGKSVVVSSAERVGSVVVSSSVWRRMWVVRTSCERRVKRKMLGCMLDLWAGNECVSRTSD